MKTQINSKINQDYINEEIETYGIKEINARENKLLNYSGLYFNAILQEMENGISKIILCLPDILIEKRKTKEKTYDFRLEQEKTKTTITKKYYFPVKTKKEFLDKLRQNGENNYVVKGTYSYNNIEKVTISSYHNPIDNIKNAHTMEITIYTKEKFKECFINELQELQNTYNTTLDKYLGGTLNITIDIDELFNNELSRILDYYEEVEDKEEILKSLDIKKKNQTRIRKN